MKTEHHTGTHVQKVARGGNAAKANEAAKASTSKDAEAAGGFSTLLTLLASDQSAPTSLGGESQPPNQLDATEIAPNVAGVSGLGLGLSDSADHSVLLAQLGQGFARPPDGAVAAGTDKGGDPSVRSGRMVHGGLKAGELSEAADEGKTRSGGKIQTELNSTATPGKGEGGVDKKDTQFKTTGHAKPDNLQNQLFSAALESRSDRHVQLTKTAELAELSAQVNRAGGMDGTLRQAERALAKFTTSRSNDSVDGVWGSQALYSGSPQGIEPTNATEGMVAPELMVAEQVKYWISQDVQNAELKIDGFDGLPVDVSITLKGNEASVDFRTDQEGIRDVLQSTETHLKEVLAREGLVLSGMSIGASLQQGSRDSHQGRNPESRRRMEVSPADTPLVGSITTQSAVAGKSIDVFV